MHGVLIAQGVRQGKSGTVSLQTVLFGLSVWEPVNRTPDNEAERSEHTASGVLNSKVRLGCALPAAAPCSLTGKPAQMSGNVI